MADATQKQDGSVKTYRCYKVCLDQFEPTTDNKGNITGVILKEKNIRTTIRRRHSVAVDQILRVSKEMTDTAAEQAEGAAKKDKNAAKPENALLYSLISVRCNIERINDAKKPAGASEKLTIASERPELEAERSKLEAELAVLYKQLNHPSADADTKNAEGKSSGTKSVRSQIASKEKCLAWNKKLLHRKRQEELLKVLFEKGFTLQKTNGDPQHFVLFLRSASMSRQGSLAFIASSLYPAVMKACTLGLHDSKTGWSEECGLLLSKYNAYCGLALSDADRIDALPCGVPPRKTDQKKDKLLLNEQTVIVLPDSIVWKFDLQKCPATQARANKEKNSGYAYRDNSNLLCWKADYPHKGQYVAKTEEQGDGKHDKLTLEAKEAKEAKSLGSPFDGEGLISPRAARIIRQALAESSGKDPAHFGSSFQIRLPFCKGMLHTVDFHGAMETFGHIPGAPEYTEAEPEGTTPDPRPAIWVTDLFGFRRDLRKAEIILTKSMFKAATWLNVEANAPLNPALFKDASTDADKDANLNSPLLDLVENKVRAPWGNVRKGFQLADPMRMYFRRCAEYDHALYLCRCSQRAHKNSYDFLNYQILATLEFDRLGYRAILDPSVKALAQLLQETPEGDAEKYRILTHQGFSPASTVDGQPAQEELPKDGTGSDYFRQALRCKPELLYSPMGRRLVQLQLERRQRDTALGRIRVHGMTRYLSSDLMAFLNALFVNAALTRSRMKHPSKPIQLASDDSAFAARGVVDASDAQKIFEFYKKSLYPAELPIDTADVPGIAPEEQSSFWQEPCGDAKLPMVSVFRNPHMSSNEQTLLFIQSSQKSQKKAEAYAAFRKSIETSSDQSTRKSAPFLAFPEKPDEQEWRGWFRDLREWYLGGLDGVCMLPARSRTATRLNGADFDGDIVRVITDARYTEELYSSLTKLWAEEMPEFIKESKLSEDDVKLDPNRPPQLPLIQMDLNHSDTTGVKLSDTDKLREKDLAMFLTSMGNRIGLFSNQCIALHSGNQTRLEIQKQIRLYTTAVGCEIDAAKTNYMVDIEAPGVNPNSRPFLRFNADIKRGKRKSSVYFYYPEDIREVLDYSTSQEGYDLLQEGNGFLDILPWYAHRYFTEQDARLLAGTIPEDDNRPQLNGTDLTPEQIAQVEWQSKIKAKAEDPETSESMPKENVQIAIDSGIQTVPSAVVKSCQAAMDTARETRKKSYQQLWYPALLWPVETAEAEKRFEKSEAAGSNLRGRTYLEYIRALFLAYNQMRKSTDSVTCDLDESMRRILFMSFPEKNAASLEEDLALLKDTLRANLPTDTGSADGTEPDLNETTQQRLQKFCKTVTNYAFLLKTDNDYKTELNIALAELRKPLNGTNQQDSAPTPDKTDKFVELCASARRDGGYLLPYYAAQTILDEFSHPSATETEDSSQKGENSFDQLLNDTLQEIEKAEKAAKKNDAHPAPGSAEDTVESTVSFSEHAAELRSDLVNAFASISTLCFEGEDGDVRMPMDSVYGQLKLRSLAKKITTAFYPECTVESAECGPQKILFLACLYLSDPRRVENKNTYDFGCFFWDLCGPYAADSVLTLSKKEAAKAEEAKKRTATEIWSGIREAFETSLAAGSRAVTELQTEAEDEREEEER